MRRFSIAHLSDLHLTGREAPSLGVIHDGLNAALQNTPKPRILLVTGDLVDSPTSDALALAKKFVTETGKLFEDTYVIPGNHDVKKWFGSFSRSNKFNDVFNTGQDLLLKDVGLHILGLDSTDADYARGGIKNYDAMIRQYYKAEEQNPAISSEERAGLMRIVAVHHHPLPLAEGEGQRILRIGPKDEGFMYLESSAQMLEACIECNVSLILHGHRHVQGVVRYSVQSSNLVTSNAYLGTQYDDSWNTIHVVSCPSSTGQGCYAGFHVLEFQLSVDGVFADVARYVRTRNQGPFHLLDRGLRPDGKIRLLFSPQLARDVAVDVEAALSRLPKSNSPEGELFGTVSNLFRRRAFMLDKDRHGGQLLYAVMKTRQVWQNEVQRRLREARQEAGARVTQTLVQLEELIAYKVLGMTSREPDELRIKYLNDKLTFLRNIPDWNDDNLEKIDEERRKLLEELKAALVNCGIRTEGFGQAAWGSRSD